MEELTAGVADQAKSVPDNGVKYTTAPGIIGSPGPEIRLHRVDSDLGVTRAAS